MPHALYLVLVTLAHPGTTAPQASPPQRHVVETELVTRPWVDGHFTTLEERMAELSVPGVSVAVFTDHELHWAAGYGTRDAASGEPVTTETLFQAASISKPVAAMLAMRLAQEGALDLEAPITGALHSFAFEGGGFDRAEPLSARHILSHTGGVTVHGFAGYATFDACPTLHQVLRGSGPANSAAITLDRAPGLGVRYSGGGTTLLQQALMDLGAQPFPELAHGRVLAPLGMARSTYAQPLPTERWPDHAAGHLGLGEVQPGRFRVHPEMAAAGLWTTPSDLARFAMELQNAWRGTSERVLDQDSARRMLTPVMDNAALGWFLEEHAGETWFGHGGSNIGFKNQLLASREGGRGVAIMTNGENGGQLMQEVLHSVARAYHWPGFVEEPLPSAELSAAQRRACVGRYELAPDEVIYVEEHDGRLSVLMPPAPRAQAAPLGAGADVDAEAPTLLLLGSRRRLRFEPGEPAPQVALGTEFERGRGARRLDPEERWPLDDLRDGDVEEALAFYAEVFEGNPEDAMVQAQRLAELAGWLVAGGHIAQGLGLARFNAELHAGDPVAEGAWAELAESLGAD